MAKPLGGKLRPRFSLLSNITFIIYEMQTFQSEVDNAVADILKEQAYILAARVKRNASGRPGPRVISGDYRRSIGVEKIEDGWAIGTDAAQGMRLEFGFTGVDSLGRYFDQPPYPHWQPAIDKTWPETTKRVEDAIGKAF